jgi:hypothetical protein
MPFLTLIAILAAFVVNVFANVAPIGGLTIGEISSRFFSEVLVIPADYAFAIWGLIYLGLFALGVYQVLPPQRKNPRLQGMRLPLVVASLAQIVWVFLFQFRLFALSLVAMFAIALSLIVGYVQLGDGGERLSRQERWFARIPLSIYLGWISVATIVNVAIVLYDLNWDGWGISPGTWTATMLIIGAVIAAGIALQRMDIAFPLVIVWAYVAIAIRNANRPLIVWTAVGLAAILALLLVVNGLRQRPSSANSP